MEKDKKKSLDGYVKEIAQWQDKAKRATDESNLAIKEICEVAQEKHQLHARVLKSLAKEKNMTDVEREERRLIQDQLDECRLALGFEKGLQDTPLGNAAEREIEEKKTKKKSTKRRGNTKEDQPQAHA